MYHCPHCNATISRAELFSKRLLRERTSGSCDLNYIEGGSTTGVGIMAAAGAIVTHLNRNSVTRTWCYFVVLAIAAVATIIVIQLSQPRKSEEIRLKLLQALIVTPFVAMATWGGMALIELACVRLPWNSSQRSVNSTHFARPSPALTKAGNAYFLCD